MRYAQINSVPYGSTGSIMLKKHEELLRDGVDSYVFWGRGRAGENERECNFGSKPEFYADVLMTRLDGRAGFHSKRATKRLLRRLDEVEPDVVHLHNLHGYYVNVEQLFGWLAAHKCKVVWTLHDCWPFTGHCAYFTYANCELWKSRQGCGANCPQLSSYPSTVSRRSVARNYREKKDLFTKLAADSLSIVTPSKWLERLTRDSYLKEYPAKTVYNTIDTNVFRPTEGSWRSKLSVDEKIVVLGVAAPWSERKGLTDFVRLHDDLGDGYAIVLVGLTDKQARKLPNGIRALGRISSQKELAQLYTMADVLFNPTREDNYPSVLLEAQACGTPVVTYDVGGCAEAVEAGGNGIVVDGYEQALESILAMKVHG